MPDIKRTLTCAGCGSGKFFFLLAGKMENFSQSQFGSKTPTSEKIFKKKFKTINSGSGYEKFYVTVTSNNDKTTNLRFLA
jgi:hypothetical protein